MFPLSKLRIISRERIRIPCCSPEKNQKVEEQYEYTAKCVRQAGHNRVSQIKKSPPETTLRSKSENIRGAIGDSKREGKVFQWSSTIGRNGKLKTPISGSIENSAVLS
jgi:hypothetical protein